MSSDPHRPPLDPRMPPEQGGMPSQQQPSQPPTKGIDAAGMALFVVALVLMVIVGVVGLGVVFYLNREDPTEPTEKAAQGRAGPPNEVNKPPSLPDWLPERKWPKNPPASPKTKEERVLMANWLYGYYVPIPKGCPTLKPRPSVAEYKEKARGLVDCLYDSWAPLFFDAGKDFNKPEVKFFDKDVKSSCRRRILKSTLYYCIAETSIYVSDLAIRIASQDKHLPYADIFRMFIFHVQQWAGFQDAVISRGKKDDETFHRLLLQTPCIQARQMLMADSMNMKYEEHAAFVMRLFRSKKKRQGSPASAVYWGTRGFYAERIGDCNTWTAPSDLVE